MLQASYLIWVLVFKKEKQGTLLSCSILKEKAYQFLKISISSKCLIINYLGFLLDTDH